MTTLLVKMIDDFATCQLQQLLNAKNQFPEVVLVKTTTTSTNDDMREIAQKELKQEHAKKSVSKKSPFELTNRLWESLVIGSGIEVETKWADLSKIQLQNLVNQLTNGTFQINGKSTFKEEFVTAGGIDLKEINFKTMESKLHENLYFAGEIVNIDAITGGFNFQNAWTSGYIVATALS